MRRLSISTRPCSCPPPDYDRGFEVKREKVNMPIFDKNGKKVRDVVKDVVVKQEHDFHNNPNDGLVYTDFTVEALQRLGIQLTPVNPAFVGDDLVGFDAQLNNVAAMEKEFFNKQTIEN